MDLKTRPAGVKPAGVTPAALEYIICGQRNDLLNYHSCAQQKGATIMINLCNANKISNLHGNWLGHY